MTIFHVGPPLARRGGPAGYLWQLASAAQASGACRPHEVTWPDREGPAPPPGPRSLTDRVKRAAGRAKRGLLGPPVQFRPSKADLWRPQGAIDALVTASLEQTCADASRSIDLALSSSADVLFAHDAAVAERLLASRRRPQQVWLFLHTPMPIALYLAWSWGVPEWGWEEIAHLPDTERWSAWEIGICSRVDRLIVPCEEAFGELVRADRRFASLAAPERLLTGGAGPSPRHPTEDRRQLRKRFTLPAEAPVGLFLGSAQPYRGLDVLLDAARVLADSVPGVVAVAGPPASAVASHRRVRALGAVGAVSDLLRAVDFVVNVNRFSLFDLSAIEAAEAGCPMLLHGVGGNGHLARLGAGVVLLPDLERDTVAAGLSEMFTAPRQRIRALGEQSRDCWERELTPAHFWARHMSLYDRAATGAAAV